ncbi:MAG: hypothetical protein Q4F05_03875 [bacterium]|nr:hypothetical protein [bacterium]
MYRYRVFGLNIASDFCLTGINEKNDFDQADVEIIQGGVNPDLLKIPEEEKNSTVGYWYFGNDDWVCVRERRNGVFYMKDGKSIHYELFEGYDPHYVKQLILCVSMAIIRVQRGLISIHGSCVEWKGKGFIISGDSGAGKSTFTTELLQHGAGFLTDDICAITFMQDMPYVQPSFPQRKLCEDAVKRFGYDTEKLEKLPDIEKGKYMVDQVESFLETPSELGGIIVIKPGEYEKVSLKEITGAEKLKYVIDNLIKLDVYSHLGKDADMYRASLKVAGKVSIYELKRPINKDTLQQMMDAFNGLQREEMAIG